MSIIASRARLLGTAFSLALLLGTSAAQAETPPNVLVVAQSIDDAVSFDPAEGFELTTVQSFNNLYQRLVQSNRQDGTKIEPALAASWTAGSDGRSLTFELADSKFSSGNPVRPEDVIFSLTRAVKLNKSPAFILNELGWKADNVDAGIIRVDDKHVKLSWSADVGSGFALSLLTAPIASIVDEKTVEPQAKDGDFGNAWLKTNSAGSGAYTIATYTPHEALVLQGNANSADKPKLDSVIIRNVPDVGARRLLVEQGDADIARGLSADQIEALKTKSGLKVLAVPSARTDYILLNTKANPTLGNPALWEAARYLVDYDGIAKNLLRGQSTVHQAFLPVGFPGALTDTPFKLDVEKAKKILADAGIKTPFKVEFIVFNDQPFLSIAQSLQSTFAQAGITLDIQPGVASDIYARGRSGKFEMTLRYWIPDYFDPHSNASAFAINKDNSSNTAAKYADWVIPELTDETLSAVKEQDAAKRVALYQDLQKKIQASSPFIFMLQGNDQVVLSDKVKNYAQGLNADQVYYDKVEK
ncbi:ABC transporter substrate-binding protein [Rhizobium hainanense]|uniref:Peptide/nickel transport system substrate-binding protein n=1 Tax=Rhizobium hainanense TaxID=52131 RepID=A0A1C3UV51_9HYPH|nr:ABC transporter substrate-binding protein [Rhizobium hainanense]SCB19396.1 peptide/nickel transport system substrate-binding protein [Rhizobium hainanense]